MSRRISCKKCKYFRRGLTCDFCGLHYYGLSFYDICDDYEPRYRKQVLKNLVINEGDAV